MIRVPLLVMSLLAQYLVLLFASAWMWQVRSPGVEAHDVGGVGSTAHAARCRYPSARFFESRKLRGSLGLAESENKQASMALNRATSWTHSLTHDQRIGAGHSILIVIAHRLIVNLGPEASS